MRPLHSLLVVVLLLAVGIGAWVLLRGFEEPAGYRTAAPPAAPSEKTGSEAPLALVQPGNTDAHADDAARVAFEGAPEPAASESAKKGSKGDVAIHGRVVDFAGKPVAGALVYAASSSGFEGPALPLDMRGIERMPWIRRVEAKCDADGRFELPGLRAGAMRLAVRKGGFAPHDDNALSVPAGEQHELETIVLDPSVFVSGRVVDARGRGVGNAEILRAIEGGAGFMFGTGRGRSGVVLATTTMDGGFLIDQLASGPCTLRVLTEDHPDQIATVTTRRLGERVQGLEITLEDGAEISGRVLGAPAGVVSTLAIRAVPAAGEDDAERGQDVSGVTGTAEIREDDCQADGSFVVRGVRPGRSYWLSARRTADGPGSAGAFFSPGLSPKVIARGGERGVELAYQPEAALAFQVIDARTRAPLTSFQVEAGIDWPAPLVDDEGRAVSEHPEGRVRFGNLRPKSSADRAQVAVRAVGYREWTRDDIALQSGAEMDLGLVELEPVPLTTVQVLDAASGAPVAKAQVVLRQAPEEDGPQFGMRRSISIRADSDDEGPESFDDGETHSARTDENGIARLTSFAGQRCQLDVSHDTHAPYESEPFLCAADAPEEHVVKLGRGGSVRARLATADGAPLAGGRVEHRVPGHEDEFEFHPGDGGRNVTDAEGIVLFEHLAPGTHRFRQQGGGAGVFETEGGDTVAIQMRGMNGEDPSGGGWTEALVTEGGAAEITILAPVRVSLTGRVREAGEELAGATVSLAPARARGRPQLPMFGPGGARGESDGRGEYELENVKSGEYVLTVTHPSRAMPAEFPLTIGEEDRRFDVELEVALIEGKITDEKGEPLAGVRVWPEQPRPEGEPRAQVVSVFAFAGADGGEENIVSFGPGAAGRTEAKTDGEGRYSLRGVLTGVDLVVHGEAKALQPGTSGTVRVEAGETKHGVDLTLAVAGGIDVQATRADGSPGRNLLVLATLEGGSGEGTRKNGFIQDTGRTRLDGLAPGSWRVSVRTIGSRDEAPQIPEQVIAVKAGESASANFQVP